MDQARPSTGPHTSSASPCTRSTISGSPHQPARREQHHTRGTYDVRGARAGLTRVRLGLGLAPRGGLEEGRHTAHDAAHVAPRVRRGRGEKPLASFGGEVGLFQFALR